MQFNIQKLPRGVQENICDMVDLLHMRGPPYDICNMWACEMTGVTHESHYARAPSIRATSEGVNMNSRDVLIVSAYNDGVKYVKWYKKYGE